MLKNLYLAVSKSKSVDMPGLPDDLTAEKMVTVVSAFFKASNDCIREVVEDLIAQARFWCHACKNCCYSIVLLLDHY